MSYITTATGKHFVGRVPDGDDRKLIFEIDDQMLSKEFHELMPEMIDDHWRSVPADNNSQLNRIMFES